MDTQAHSLLLSSGLPPICLSVVFPLIIPNFRIGLPRWCGGKESAWQCRGCKRCGFFPLGQEDPLEKEMATHSSILACKIPQTEEPGGLQSSGSQKVEHD